MLQLNAISLQKAKTFAWAQWSNDLEIRQWLLFDLEVGREWKYDNLFWEGYKESNKCPVSVKQDRMSKQEGGDIE